MRFFLDHPVYLKICFLKRPSVCSKEFCSLLLRIVKDKVFRTESLVRPTGHLEYTKIRTSNLQNNCRISCIARNKADAFVSPLRLRVVLKIYCTDSIIIFLNSLICCTLFSEIVENVDYIVILTYYLLSM